MQERNDKGQEEGTEEEEENEEEEDEEEDGEEEPVAQRQHKVSGTLVLPNNMAMAVLI